jgi:hypothetical protein
VLPLSLSCLLLRTTKPSQKVVDFQRRPQQAKLEFQAMKTILVANLTLTLATLLVLGGCKPKPDINAADSADDGADSSESASDKKVVKLPDDPFFTDFAYPGATLNESLTMAGSTSVWFKSSDDFSKITDFYTGKFAGGTTFVEAERGIFALPDATGLPCGATVTK